MTNPDDTDDLDMRAAEYVLGLADAADQASALRRLASEPDFAARVEDWRRRLQPLDDAAPVAAAGADLWRRIEATTAAPRRAPASRPSPIARVWESLAFWRGLGLSGAFAALVLAVGLGAALMRAPPRPVLVAVLLTDANRPAAIVDAFAGGEARLVPLEAIAVPPGKILEIWTLWDRAVGPRSIGRLDQAAAVNLSLKDLPLGPNQLFEITLEPAGGSPIGRPTGPILMKGTTSQAL